MPRPFLIALLIIGAVPLAAEPTSRKVTRILGEELKRYGRDLAGVARAPLSWDEEMWERVGLVAGANALAFAVDDDITRFAQRNRSKESDEVFDFVTPFGGRRGFYVAGLALLTGVATDNPQLRDSGRDAIESAVIAAGVINPLVKTAVGRSRPHSGEGPFAFDPGSGNLSFPSGHTTTAFAIASVFAEHYERGAVPVIAYTLAGGVGMARIHDNVHYLSDVIAGAAIGTAIGRSIVARHRREPASRQVSRVSWSVVPLSGGAMVRFSVR